MYLRLLAFVPTSAGFERVFSTMGMVEDGKRNNLDSAKTAKLLFVRVLLIQKYLRNVRRSTTVPSEMYLDGEKARSDQDKAELFNRYFHSVYSNIPYDSNLDSDNATLLNHFHFNIIEIEDILKNLNINKSKGPDRMGNLLFKQLWSSISKSLMLLFNTIGNKQQFPSTWKVSEIVPIHK